MKHGSPDHRPTFHAWSEGWGCAGSGMVLWQRVVPYPPALGLWRAAGWRLSRQGLGPKVCGCSGWQSCATRSQMGWLPQSSSASCWSVMWPRNSWKGPVHGSSFHSREHWWIELACPVLKQPRLLCSSNSTSIWARTSSLCSGWALKQIAPRGGGISLTENIQDLSGHNPVSGMTLLEQGDWIQDCCGPFQSCPFCDSVILWQRDANISMEMSAEKLLHKSDFASQLDPK